MQRVKLLSAKIAAWQSELLLSVVYFLLGPLAKPFSARRERRGWRSWQEADQTLAQVKRQ